MLQKIVQLHAIVILGSCALLARSDMLALSMLCVIPIPSTIRMLLIAAVTPVVAVILVAGVT